MMNAVLNVVVGWTPLTPEAGCCDADENCVNEDDPNAREGCCPRDQIVCGGNCCFIESTCCGDACCPKTSTCHNGVCCRSDTWTLCNGKCCGGGCDRFNNRLRTSGSFMRWKMLSRLLL